MSLGQYLSSVAAGLDGNTSPLAAGLSSFSKARRYSGLSSGISDYSGAKTDEEKKEALQKMAEFDPEYTANFITKQKILKDKSTGGYDTTNQIKNAKYLIEQGYTPEQARMVAFNIGKNDDKKAFALGMSKIASGDESGWLDIAQADPEYYLKYLMQKQKQDNENERQDKRNQLERERLENEVAKRDVMQQIAKDKILSDAENRDMNYKIARERMDNSLKVNGSRPVSGQTNQIKNIVFDLVNSQISKGNKQTQYEKTLEQQLAKKTVEEEKEREGALKELEQLKETRNRLFGKGGLMEKANVGYNEEDNMANRIIGIAKRNIPTALLNKETQISRQEIDNVLSQLRLDQFQYLKGAISDKEQEMIRDFVTGDISKYSPEQIKGTFNSLINKLSSKYGVSKEDSYGSVGEDVVDYSEFFK